MGVQTTKGDLAVALGGRGRVARHAVPAVNGQVLIADSSQSDGWIADNPASRREIAMRPTGAIAETISRAHEQLTSQAANISGTLYATGIALPANRLLTSATFMSGVTALVTGSNQWFCLLDSALNVLAKTSDDGATAWAANAAKTLNFSAPFTTTYSGLHYLGLLIVAATVPTIAGISHSANAVGLIVPAAAGSSTAGLTNPASLGGAASALVTPANKQYWAWVS